MPDSVCVVVSYRDISGDATREETHVPIPNTTVKLTRPMIVQNSAKVGCCRVFGGLQKCRPLFLLIPLIRVIDEKVVE